MYKRGTAQITADALALLGTALVVAAMALAVANRGLEVNSALADPPKWFATQNALSAVVFLVPGWYLATKAPRSIFGWILLAGGIGHGLAGAGWGYMIASEIGGRHLLAPSLGLVFGGPGAAVEVPILGAIATFYPDGKRPRGWIGVAGWTSIALGLIGVITAFVDPLTDLAKDANSPLAGLRNPIGIEFFTRFDEGGVLWMAPSGVLATLVAVVRWWKARGEVRQLLGWLVAAWVAGLAFAPLALLGSGWFMLSAQLPTILILSALVAATLRHRVYGIEVVISRAFAYTALLAIVGIVFGAVVGLASLAGSGGGLGVSVGAAAAAAFVFAPAKDRVERLINRMLFGERDQPYAVLSRMAAQVELAGSPDGLLPRLAAQIAQTLRLPFVAVEYGEAGTRRSISTGPQPASSDRFPIVHGGSEIGALIAGHRTGERGFSPSESQLLQDLARQASATVANLMLTEDLLRSREQIVTTREEERRRLRRDLHDGLGPVLTGAAMMIDAGRNLMSNDLQAADQHLLDARAQVKTAIEDVRRLVYALRPPALDELGLVGALREQSRHGPLRVTVRADGELADLPAAVEVAAFRIISEAVTNAARHSNATECEVGITLNGRLSIAVDDNGTVAGDWRTGVGIISMRERASELGGTCEAGPAEDGHGRVRAEIPVEVTA